MLDDAKLDVSLQVILAHILNDIFFHRLSIN